MPELADQYHEIKKEMDAAKAELYLDPEYRRLQQIVDEAQKALSEYESNHTAFLRYISACAREIALP
jgi:hypothetical protein